MPVTLITGASTGIGAALALELARRGHSVGLIARRSELLAELAGRIEQAGGKAAYAAVDVTRKDDLEAAVRELESRLGPCDLLVANAGSGTPTHAKKNPVADIEWMIDINVRGVLYAVGAVRPGMVERKRGHVAAVSSVAGFRGLPAHAGYSASKAYVTTMFESFRVDLRPLGIACTAIHPGYIDTPLTRKNKFYMPWLMSAEKAAKIIADGLDRRKAEVTFPWQMYLLMSFARLVPNWIYDRLVTRAAPGK